MAVLRVRKSVCVQKVMLVPSHYFIVIGAFAAVTIATAALRVRAVTRTGAVAAACVGTLCFGASLTIAAALVTFFVTSSLLSRWRNSAKKLLGFEKTGERDALQVLANGGVAAVLSAILVLRGQIMGSPLRDAITVVVLASLASANADTWATEIGSAYGVQPRLILTGRLANRGESGAVSVPGAVASLLGALVIALFAAPFGHVRAMVIVTLSGCIGSLVDSMLGATLQAHWRVAGSDAWTEKRVDGMRPERGLWFMNNDAVNFVSIVIACLAAAVLCVN